MSLVNSQQADWWRQAVVYQVYPRSFADASGDGLGDLAGVTSRVDYLRDLGVDAVWLSPFYPSQLADGGYDVDDYRNVDPRLGTLDDFDRLVAALHEAGMKIVVDIVPNHTSNRHEWFQQALADGPGSPARDRYIFRDGAGPDGSEPPTDWRSMFGGPAWTRVGDGQWYLHLFASEQPDLNWDNPDVHADFVKTLRFWSDRGVDGFRIDVAHGLKKNLTEPLPTWEQMSAMSWGTEHPLWDRDDVQQIYAEWREVFNSYDPPRSAVAEAWVSSDRVPRYANPQSLGQAFNFDLLRANFEAASFRRIVTHNVELAGRSGSSSTWVLSNHDVIRHPTRYGLPFCTVDQHGDFIVNPGREWVKTLGTKPQMDATRGLERARAATLFILALPGASYIYQGEELGLHEVATIPAEDRQDPTFFRSAGFDFGRDGCRVPLPWTREGVSYGFGDAAPHLPQPSWFADCSVEAETGQPDSTLSMYRQALAARRKLQTAESMEWVETGRNDVLSFTRPNGWACVTNFGDEDVAASDLSEAARELLARTRILASREADGGVLPARATVWTASDWAD
ncbi:MAG: alpha-amylase family glycosyl hydrolase [Actinomycetaceae bacterium]|nr:alpha-amylase family glycosyl hydrolase [Actinomycetaceae bacterium]MDU0969829.1 alpha-amylase family glycosyl hydrolase [Actinomycetaceae bacterium]